MIRDVSSSSLAQVHSRRYVIEDIGATERKERCTPHPSFCDKGFFCVLSLENLDPHQHSVIWLESAISPDQAIENEGRWLRSPDNLCSKALILKPYEKESFFRMLAWARKDPETRQLIEADTVIFETEKGCWSRPVRRDVFQLLEDPYFMQLGLEAAIDPDEIRFENQIFLFQNLSRREFQNKTFKNCSFRMCSFRSRGVPTNLSGTKFVGCHLKNIDFSGSDLSESYFKDCTLDGAVFDRSILHRAQFWNCSMNDSSLVEIMARDLLLLECELKEARLTEAYMPDAHITRVDMRDSDLSMACLNHASLVSSSFEGANLRAIKANQISLDRCRLVEADLTGALLTRLEARGSDFMGSDLTECQMVGSQIDTECLFGPAPEPEDYEEFLSKIWG